MIDVPRPRSGRPCVARCLAFALGAVPLPLLPTPAHAAQAVVPTANPDADRLADVVRRLGAAPRDLSALIEAGDLSFTLGDATAAAAFYKRAEAIDPNNGRVKAGIARILVNGERPGEALRYFEQAQRFGAPMAHYADDRGLAYDLIGEQERAQQDYRLALAQGGRDADALDEIRRRYALSLGISGKQEESLAQIDTLLRRSDRGAWRARAFILAMNGDVAGANKIATSMMPRGTAGGLTAFFQRLPSLSPIDRAFAVHFGEVTPTAARLADARMVPHLPPLATATPRVTVAAAPAVAPTPPVERRQSRSEQRRRDREARAAQVAANSPRGAGSTIAARPQVAATAPAPSVPAVTPTPTPTPAPTQVAAATPPRPVFAAPAPQVQPLPRTETPASTTQPVPRAETPASVPAQPTQVAAVTTPVRRAPVRIPSRAVPPRLSEDSILARIVAGISVPAAELGVAPMPGSQRPVVVAPPAPSAASLDEAARAAERNVAADEPKRARLAVAKRISEKVAPEKVEEEKPAAKPVVDRKTRAKELAAEKAKKEAAAKEAAEKKAARAEPERFWVQVASGANAADLPKAWKAAQGKAGALAGKRAYTVPNRASNRLVTGPFKTEAEARAMVNTLNKQGVSAFGFTSEAGQKMTRLDGGK